MVNVYYTTEAKPSPNYSKGVKMFSGRGLAKTHRTNAEAQKALSGAKVGKTQRKQK